MIKLTSDSSNIDEYLTALTRTASNNGKLFKATYDEATANRSRDDLLARGYAAHVDHSGNVYRVYYSTLDPKLKCTESTMSNFEQVDDVHYRMFEKTAGVYDYPYDDGSIWRVVKYEDGEYLVKEVADDDEDDVVRQKQASTTEVNDIRQAVTARFGSVSTELLDIINSNGVLRNEFSKILNTGGVKLD